MMYFDIWNNVSRVHYLFIIVKYDVLSVADLRLNYWLEANLYKKSLI